jgi:hypothetical protein
VMRICRPALAVLAGLSLVVAGCGSSGTASPGKTSTAGGATATASAPVATPTPVNPDTLFDLGIAGGPSWKSFHVKVALEGTVKAAFVKSAGAAAPKSDVALAGLVIEGDVDAVNLALHMAIDVPAIPGVISAAATDDLIIKNSIMYVKASSLGAKYHQTKLGTISKDLGLAVAVPTPGGSALTGMADAVSSLRQHLEANGSTPKVAGIEQIGGKDAYRIDLTVPLDKLNGDIAAAAASASADPSLEMTVDSASASIWIYKDTYQLAQVQLAGASSTVGNLSFTMTLTNFDQPVTIDAPAAKDIQP